MAVIVNIYKDHFNGWRVRKLLSWSQGDNREEVISGPILE